MHRAFTAVSPRAGRDEVLDLMRARSIGQIPIVDEDGRLIGLHLLHQMIGATQRSNWAVVMAGGEGRRLRPLTDTTPKPMLRVAGRPILERIVFHLVGFGFRRIFLSINYLGHRVEQHFGDGSRFGCRIEYLREDRPLGTAGALSLLPERPPEPILVMNGDLVTQADLGEMLASHVGGGQCATMAVRRYVHTVPFGCVDLDGDRVIAMEEKPQVARLVNAGIYILDPAVVAEVPKDTAVGMPTILEQRIANGGVVRAFEIKDDWIDVGQRDQLSQAQRGGDA
jgi:NDP-sugar pyrophosphorylase family protein